MSKKEPLTPISEILQKTLGNLPVIETFQVYPIWKKWAEIVGPSVAAKTSPDFVRNKTLFVSVENSVWLNQLNFQKNSLLAKIATLNLEHKISDIRFRLRKEP